MFDDFKMKAEGVGAEVHRVATVADAAAFISAVLRKEQVTDAAGSHAVWAEGPARAEVGRDLAIPGLKLEVTRPLAAEAKVGISQADWALADTGTLVQDQSAVEQRLVSSLPEIHVALLATGSILPDKLALLKKMDPRKSRYIAFITGPSRTADIERVLTIGVHGPKRVVILCIDELGVAK